MDVCEACRSLMQGSVLLRATSSKLAEERGWLARLRVGKLSKKWTGRW